MRSIHKKTLKRFLSTLLAVVMVLGMVPFTALAAPAGETAGQVSGSWTKYDAQACVLKSDVQPNTQTGTQYTTVYVDIDPADGLASAPLKLKIGTEEIDIGSVTTDSSGYITSPTTGPTGTTTGGIAYTIGFNATLNPTKLEVKATNVPLVGCSTSSFPPVHPQIAIKINEGTDVMLAVSVPRKADLTLTVPTSAVTAGEDFTVKATSDVAEGRVQFEYNGSKQSVEVIPMLDGSGYAEYTFKAVAGATEVKATQFGMSGGVVNSDVKTATITLGTADTYYDVTFLPGAADAYIPFSPTTVSVKQGDSYPLPTAIPTREGYTFKGWDKNGDGTADYAASAASIPAADITDDMTLNAVWEETKYTIKYSKDSSSAAAYTSQKTIAAAVGETVYFGVTVPDGYDASTMCVVVENTIVLAPYSSFSGTNETTYCYSFVLTQNMASGGFVNVVFTGPSKLTYTVTMPVGHFTAKITTANGATIDPAVSSTNVNYDSSYTFTVTPASGYEIKGVYVNGEDKGTGGTYTVTNVTSAQTVEVVVDAIPSYTVTYVVNDAQYTTQKVTSGSAIGTLPDNPVVEGYTFNSWNTKQDGHGTEVTTATTVDSDMTVYAKLTAKTYTITYNPNGGSGAPTAGSKTHGTAVALASEIPTRTGYTFLGWSTSSSAKTPSYQPGEMYSNEGNVTLYAVWQIKTFTVTLPNGTGYTAMPATGSSSPVDYGKNFTFTVTVDPEYAVTKPTVKVGNTDVTNSLSGSNPYTYTINNITADQVVSIQVTKNPVHTVTFQYTLPGSSTPTVYQTQQVEHNAKATVPNPPSVEGYTFGGWQWDLDNNASTPNVDFDFGTSITKDITLYAVMNPITSTVTLPTPGANDGWTIAAASGSSNPVAYKGDYSFTITVKNGYDATNMQVAANGLALAPSSITDGSDNTKVYTYDLKNITADQNITVVGVVRKMITITYNDNGGIGGPGQEQVPMYVAPGIGDEGQISTVKPTRVGYEFLGWATANNATTVEYAAGATADFTTDTTLYAVWKEKTVTVSLTVDKNSQYEGEDVTLTASVTSGTGSTAVTSGSVQFYRYTGNPADDTAYANENNWKLLDSKVLSGGKATLTIATSDYVRAGQNKDSYKAVFVPDEGAGYSISNSAATKVTVNVLSTAISWKLNGENIDTNGNTLTIKNSNGATVTSMIAGQVYTLELPAIYALDATTYSDATKLVVNKDYKVTWQFCNASGTWEDYTASAGTDSVKILAAYSKYVFRAVVTPLTGATGHFTQAAVYDDPATAGDPKTLKADTYEAYLVTESTPAVAQQATKTKLEVSDTHDLGSTKAEFEGQKVTLTATVTLSGSSTTKVTTGEVYFYKNYNLSTKTGTLIGKADVQSDGTATLEAEMSTYSYLLSDRFTAVYQDNATYKTSTSNEELVRIRSTAIAWAGSKALTVDPTGDIYADNQYTLALPSNGIVEDGQSSVILAVGTDYVVSWYMVKADNTVVLLAENTESNTYTVVPPTAGVTYYAVVSPKAGSNYTDAYEGSEPKNFLTSAETDESVKAPTVTTITFGEVKTGTGTPNYSQYEEKTITITAKVVEGTKNTTGVITAKSPEEVVKSGTVTFYVVTKNDGTYEKIGTATVSNGLATVSYTLPEYDLADALSNIEYIFAVYSDTAGTYADSNTTENGTVGATVVHTNVNAETEAVQILSTSISWKLDGDNKIVATPDANKLKVYNATAEGAKGSLVSDGKMTAGSSYVLELPAVYALDDAKSATPTALTVKKDYKVTWQYREFGTSQWGDYPNTSAGNTVLITPDYSGYQFQAVVTPIYDNAALTGYKTAAAYDAHDVATGKTNSLVTDPTEKTELQKTTTTLAITGADKEVKNTVINGTATFAKDHWAQYESQTVTLTATVKETSTGTPDVESGVVRFYRYVDGTNDAFLGEVALDSNGNASLTDVTISAYNTAKVVTENRDLFYAVYVGTDTYETSTSTSDTTDNEGYRFAVSGKYYERVFIKSTAIQTPVITSELEGKIGTATAKATTYNDNLTDLLAGVEHKFTLRETGAEATGLTSDWSVVALDGRTVAAKNYDIQWLVTTGSNEEQAPNDATQASFVVNESKNGDKYRVKLIHKGDMTADAFSNYVVINSLQDVTVLVTASDKIDSTAATDVYQLNDITLTAEVQGKDSQIMLPTGNVTFYYSVNGTNWVEIGTAALKPDDVSGTMKATFVTDKLPVDVVHGYKQEEVTITAVYAGDETFQKSGEFNTTTKEITDTVAGAVTDETVTVYSSVVLVHAAEENTAVTSLTNGGIHISANGSLVANETDVALTLQQVYTLDYGIDLSKLVYGTDYTVEWQILENASLYNQSGYYGNTEKWNDIGATGSSYTIGTVPQDAAYRAEITVTNTAPVQGSAQGVLQDDADDMTTGRKVYYSNVLVVGAGQATVTTNITTSANTKFNEEGIVKGETVTIHALVAGAAKVTPISNLTATILPQGVTDPALAVFTDEKDNVNGYNAFTWDTTNVTPGYYTLTVVATSNNGYAPQKIERTLIVRDKTYTLTATNESKVYNGKAQGIDWTLTGVDIEDELAQKSVVVYYYQDGKMVEPTQAGTYTYELYLPASAYWTELTHVTGTFTIEKRDVSVVDLIAQAKVYDGTTNVNIQEIILNDAVTDQTTTGLPTGNTGVINGDSVYATVENLNVKLNSENAGANAIEFTIKSDELKGDDADNYKLVAGSYTGEAINVQRSQVKGDIANSTFKYTGSNITVPADDIYLIDQAGNQLSNYTVTYYYHNGDGVEQVTAMNKLGKYTVIARPEQDNYKGGASETVYVVSGTGTDANPTTYTSALINITNTVELYGATTGIQASATNGATITKIEYQNGTGWTETVPTDAGRYLVKVTASTDDTAYGIYTIVKARPEFAPTTNADEVTYNSAPYSGTVDAGFVTGKSDSTAETYITYTGGTIQGIAYEAPTEVGKYIATVHVGETANYTAHEEQVAFEIKPKALTITADDLARWQYGSYPDMVATFQGLATGGVAADTSLRDVQIQPEFIFNDLNGDGQPEYTNSALDQVGKDYPITVRNALARNYTVTYVAGSYAVNELDPKADLAIHGMIDNGLTPTQNIAYYGDQIQLYAYGNYKSNGDGTGVYNPSSLLEWSLSAGAPATIDQDGLLTITGVGDFTVTLTRGSGDAKISTSITITALKQEVKVVVPNVDKVYNATEQTNGGASRYAVNAKLETVASIGTDNIARYDHKRTNVGSQIVTAKVKDSVDYYQSETYGGLFTINDKEATVTPGAQTTVYGTAETYDETKYTVTGKEGSVEPVTDVNVASVVDAYANLDVLDGYEILVAGVENMNYNVKYVTDVTDGSTPDAQVTAKTLTFKTGVIDSDGRTSGYMESNSLFFEDAGYAITGTSFNTTPNDRMYGEVNPVMDYAFDALIAGDSEADLVSLLDWLVKYSDGVKHNINGDANVKFDKTHHLNGYRATTNGEFISGTVNNYVIDGMLAADGVKNYMITVNANEATQNIYQRPVTLALKDSQTKLDVYIEDAKNDTILMNIIKQNLEVSGYTYGSVEYGGLAEKLGHTMENLQLAITHKTVDHSGDYIVHVKVGNPNYWLSNTCTDSCAASGSCGHSAETFSVKIHVTTDSIKVVYNEPNALGWTSASVVMHKMPEDQPVNLSADSKVYFAIYEDKGEGYDYSGETKIRSGWMNRASQTGVWTCTYSRLTAGNYRIFAIPVGDYTIINSGNVPVPAYPNP